MTIVKKIILALMVAGMLLAVFAESLPAAAAQKKHDMAGMETKAESQADAAYMAAMDKMHKNMMAVKSTGNPDVDFVRGMIPHHQGAVDMARVVLKHGKDPEIRKLAESVVSAQESEIKQMKDWLATHPAK
jgi:uncharacterized protein (DUF305 family)